MISSGLRVVASRQQQQRLRLLLRSTQVVNLSTSAASNKKPPSSFAVIDHAKVYQQAMEGRHGQQLQLTELDAMGKDDPDFDPFKELELDANAVQQLEEEQQQGDDDVIEELDEGIEEAEYKEIGAADDEVESDSDSDSDDEEDSDDDEDDEDDAPMYYRNDGSVPYKKSQLAKFQAGAPAGGVFCILELPGTQHKVTIDDVIVQERLKPVSHYAVGSVHTLTDVLLVGSTSSTLVGMPHVSGAEVDVMVEEITQDAKVVIFKKRRKKNSQRRNGFRRDVTLLRVLDIRMPAGYNTDGHHVPRVEPMV